MKTGDYTKIFTRKDENPHEHHDNLKKCIHENRQVHGLDHIHEHKLSLNHEQVMDMHERSKNRVHGSHDNK